MSNPCTVLYLAGRQTASASPAIHVDEDGGDNDVDDDDDVDEDGGDTSPAFPQRLFLTQPDVVELRKTTKPCCRSRPR